MATTSARLRFTRGVIRLCGVFSLGVCLFFLSAPVVWPLDFFGRGADAAGLTLGVQSADTDRPRILRAGNNNGSLQRNYQEWQSLTPQEKENLRRRMQQLNRMPPQDRQHLQQLNDRFQRLSPAERNQLQRSLDNWNTLSPSEREAVRRRFGN